jgi:hypothetical protein
MKKLLIVLVLGILFVPSFSYAQVASSTPTQADLQEQIAELKSQIIALLQQYIAQLQDQLTAQGKDIATIKEQTAPKATGGETDNTVVEKPFTVFQLSYEPENEGEFGDIYVAASKPVDVSRFVIKDENGKTIDDSYSFSFTKHTDSVCWASQPCDSYIYRIVGTGKISLPNYGYTTYFGDVYSQTGDKITAQVKN